MDNAAAMQIQVKEEQISDNEGQLEAEIEFNRAAIKKEKSDDGQIVIVKNIERPPVEFVLALPAIKEEPQEEEAAAEQRPKRCIKPLVVWDPEIITKCGYIRKAYFRRADEEVEQQQSKRTFVKQAHKKQPSKQKWDPFQCRKCNIIFQTKEILTIHRKTHLVHRYKCLKCPRTFRVKSRLLSHQQIQHAESHPFSCDICLKKFAILQQVHRHMVSHTKKMEYKCEVCERCFNYQKNLNNHMEHHAGIKFKCDFCDGEFSSRNTLRTHKNVTHFKKMGNRIKCEKCDFLATSPSNLKIHQRAHIEWIEAETIECLKCKKKLRNKASLAHHMSRTHSERQFHCHIPDCNFVGGTLQQLKSHQATHDQKYKCGICDKFFSNKHQLTNHILMQHKTPSVVEKTYEQLKQDQAIGEMKHILKCGICEKFFSSKNQLTNHILMQHKNIV